MGGAGGTARARGTLSHVPLGSSTACFVGLVLGRVTSATSSTCRSQALCTLHCCSSTGAVLRCGAGPGWGQCQGQGVAACPGRSIRTWLGTPAEPCAGQRETSCGLTEAKPGKGDCGHSLAVLGKDRGLGSAGDGGADGQQRGHKKRLCPLTPWASSEGTAGCAGQSQRCRVLGEETLDTGRTAAEGTVYHVPWM